MKRKKKNINKSLSKDNINIDNSNKKDSNENKKLNGEQEAETDSLLAENDDAGCAVETRREVLVAAGTRSSSSCRLCSGNSKSNNMNLSGITDVDWADVQKCRKAVTGITEPMVTFIYMVALVCLFLFMIYKSQDPLREYFGPAPWINNYDNWFFMTSQGIFKKIRFSNQ